MPAAETRSPIAHPVELIRDAILWVRASGIPVRIGSRGVICSSQHVPRWSKDPASRGVDPLGAVLLNAQPDVEGEDEALAEALFAPVPWVLAFDAGLNREDFVDAWASATDRRLRAAGYEAGCRFREEIIRVAPAKAVTP